MLLLHLAHPHHPRLRSIPNRLTGSSRVAFVSDLLLETAELLLVAQLAQLLRKQTHLTEIVTTHCVHSPLSILLLFLRLLLHLHHLHCLLLLRMQLLVHRLTHTLPVTLETLVLRVLVL